jgi:uncharacterized glyoxalase superfamily protein PhnB
MGSSQPRKCAPLCVMLTVKDMNKTMAFYRDVLGFTVAERWPENDPACWANLMLGEQSIMIGPAMPASKVDEMCGQADAATKAHYKEIADAWTKNKPGIGTYFYIKVDDVDAFHDRAVTKGLTNCGKPTSQFYGLRDFWAVDPDGYQLAFYKPIQMSSCQSCGMPLKDAEPGVMYCNYCTNEKGQLKPYAEVLEGTIQGYFMAMQKMPRPQAEKAAKEHLAKMPAWAVKH